MVAGRTTTASGDPMHGQECGPDQCGSNYGAGRIRGGNRTSSPPSPRETMGHRPLSRIAVFAVIVAPVLAMELFGARVCAGDQTQPNRPQASYTETIPGSAVRFEMVAIPGGAFRM